jgi:hypothetical protein
MSHSGLEIKIRTPRNEHRLRQTFQLRNQETIERQFSMSHS